MCSYYQAHDKEAILLKDSIKIFEIIQSKKMEVPKMCLTTKTPKLDGQNIPISTFGVSVDVTSAFFRIGQFLAQTHWEKGKNCVFLNSYRIDQNTVKGIQLSPRESECLFFYVRNRSAKEIGRILKLSPRTVQFYIENIKEKFHACSKAELFDKAIEYAFFNIIPESIFKEHPSILLENF